MKSEAIINCGTDGCRYFGQTIAAILLGGGVDSPEADEFSESFGQSGEESPECYCPACKELGELADVTEGPMELAGYSAARCDDFHAHEAWNVNLLTQPYESHDLDSVPVARFLAVLNWSAFADDHTEYYVVPHAQGYAVLAEAEGEARAAKLAELYEAREGWEELHLGAITA